MTIVNVQIEDQNGGKFQKSVEVHNDQLVKCGVCGGSVLLDGKKGFKISRLLVGAPQDIYVQVPIPYCAKCGNEIDNQPQVESENVARDSAALK